MFDESQDNLQVLTRELNVSGVAIMQGAQAFYSTDDIPPRKASPHVTIDPLFFTAAKAAAPPYTLQ
eukprot:2897212-Amphidinium_carterae.1